MCKLIAVANQKGGVGKTVTTFNLGAALAEKGKNVLLIDLDPQANLSEYFGFYADGKPTMSQLISEVTVHAEIEAETVRSAIRISDNGMSYIPADLSLAAMESAMSTALSRETIIKRILSEEVTGEYDYVLMDCLPSLGILLINALSAADNVLIPVQTQKFSMDGLSALTALYRQIKATINPKLEIAGILPTMADSTTVSRNALEKLAERHNKAVFETVIHKSIEAAKSTESGIALCKSRSRLGGEYMRLADEILERCS